MVEMEDIKKTVYEVILKEFLPGENPDELKDSTSLIMGGILDSISTIKLVAFLEESYGIEFESHEISVDNFDNISDIAKIVQSKVNG